MHESGRDSAQISRETQKSGSQSDLQRLRGKKVEGRLKPAEADRALCTGQRILDTKSQKLDVKKINK